MKILRIILAVVVGYVVYAFGSMYLVAHAMLQEGPLVVFLCLVGLALIGLVAGLAAMKISGGGARTAAYILAGLVLLATLANLLLQLGAEPLWYKVGTLALTAPAILLVGLRGAAGNQAS